MDLQGFLGECGAGGDEAALLASEKRANPAPEETEREDQDGVQASLR